jgi:hypothetical protein
MQLHFTPEQEAQLALMAANAGTDAEHLVKDVVLRLLEDEAPFRTAAARIADLASRCDGFSPPARHLRRCPLSRGILDANVLVW